MKRILGIFLAAIVLAGLYAPHAQAASRNNFRISSYDIQYELSRHSEGFSVLTTTEHITADFPLTNENHGIERAIPTSYDGHPVSLSIEEVTDEFGSSIPYTTSENGDIRVLRIGDADEYVHGTQQYQIRYTQRDVTRYFGSNDRDEWYWDTNGTEWRVPIDSLTVTATLDPSLASARRGEQFCYRGRASSTDRCTLVASDTASNVYTVTATDLSAGENVTLALGFTKGTFAAYVMSTSQKIAMIWPVLQVITTILAMMIVTLLTASSRRRSLRTSETKPIVAEYIPPRDTSVTVASQLVATSQVRPVFSAQLLDLAVRRVIAIIETRKKSLFRAAEYDIEVRADVSLILEEEREILSDMFGRVPVVGDRVALSSLKNNISYASRTRDNTRKVKALINDTYGLRAPSPATSKFFYRWAIGLLIVAVLMLSIPLAVAALTAYSIGRTIRPLTDKGLALRRYLLGLDVYIKASETRRLAFLQGPDTAEKIGYAIDPSDPSQLVKLYERTLPYAVLFGREKEWSKRLGEFYQVTQANPEWYAGNDVFNAVVFSATIHNFSQASSVASGYSAGASSSSTGGSSGGGFSGGGGGGGGGGGW